VLKVVAFYLDASVTSDEFAIA